MGRQDAGTGEPKSAETHGPRTSAVRTGRHARLPRGV